MSTMSHGVDSTRAHESTSASQGESSMAPDKMNCFVAVFYLLLSSMTVNQNTVMIQAKEINANAQAQDALNSMNAAVKFSLLPSANANSQEIDKVQDANENYAAIRQNIQGCAITVRQVGSVLSNQASANVDVMQQQATIASSLLGVVNTVVQEINQMSPGSG